MFPDSFVVIPSLRLRLQALSRIERLGKPRDGREGRRLSEREASESNLSILFLVMLLGQWCALSQRGRLFMATFQLKHHSLDVLVVLVPTQELQTFLRVAPLQNLDGFLASAPRIHFTLIRHV